MAGVIPMHACVWLMIPPPPFSGTEETGDEEEGDNGNVTLRTINTCSGPLGTTSASWCHLSSKIEFSIRSSSVFPSCAPLLQLKNVLLSQRLGTKKSLNYVWL